MIRVWIRTHPFAKILKRVCHIITWRTLGQSPTKENSALLECHSALQKCWIGLWTLNVLSRVGAIWNPFLGFFGWFLYLEAFSSSVYDFSSLYLDTIHVDRANLIMWYLSIWWSDLETGNTIATIRISRSFLWYVMNELMHVMQEQIDICNARTNWCMLCNHDFWGTWMVIQVILLD